MTEETLVIILVWLITAHVFIEFLVHLSTWWVLKGQRDRSPVGPALRRRELSLAFRHFLMFGFHLILASVVTYERYPVPTEVRIPLYVMIILTAIIASIYGVNLIIKIRQDRQRVLRTRSSI